MRFGEDLEIPGIVWPTPHKEKVAICGFADSWNQAPFNDLSWEIWGLNSLFEIIPRYDRWFDIHERYIFGMDTNKEIGLGLTRTGQPYMEYLAQMKCPIYMVEKYADIPMAIRFPVELMLSEFNPKRENKLWEHWKNMGPEDWNGYLTNSISCMIALAVMEGFKEIGLYGVDMATTAGWNEYSMQRPSCEYYIGVAVGRGIKITLPDGSDLLKNRFMYGYQDQMDNRYSKKLDLLFNSMNQRYLQTLQQLEGARKSLDQYAGAMECVRETKRIWGNCWAEQEGKGYIDKGLVNLMFATTSEGK